MHASSFVCLIELPHNALVVSFRKVYALQSAFYDAHFGLFGVQFKKRGDKRSSRIFNDQINPYILSSLYLQFIDTLGSKYMLMVQDTIQ